MLWGFSENEALSYRIWNPKLAGWWRVGTRRSSRLSHLIPQPIRLSPLRELSPAEMVDDYASTDDLLRDAWDYTVVLDFNVNIPAEDAYNDSVESGPGMEPILEQIHDATRKILLIPPGESLSGGASSVETSPGGTLPETSSPSSAPDPMPASDQAALTPALAPSPAPSSEPALTRVRAASVSPRRQNTQWHRQPGGTFRATYTAQLARECVALSRVRLRLHLLYRKPFGGGGDKPKVPNTFEKAISLSQAA